MYKALSIRQPYAWAICAGYKDIENRDWSTNFRGGCLIHAGKQEETDDVEDVIDSIAFQTGRDYDDVLAEYNQQKALGCIVGAVNITDCVAQSDSDWFYGPYGFVLTNARACKPVPYKGQLRFFTVPEHVIANTSRI